MSETASSQEQPAGSDIGSKTTRQKAAKVLPTDRIRFEKQLDILRAFAAKSGHERKAVTHEEAGAIVDMAPSTITQATPFFVDAGLIVREKKADSRGFVPAPEVTAYWKAYEWDRSNAAKKLSPLLSGAWFTEALMPKLKFRPVNEKEATNDLGEIASVGPEKEDNIRIIIDYMAAAGLVERDAAGMLRVAAGAPASGLPVAGQGADIGAPAPASADLADSGASPTAEAMTRILKQRPPREVRDAVLKIILYLTMGDEAFQGGDER